MVCGTSYWYAAYYGDGLHRIDGSNFNEEKLFDNNFINSLFSSGRIVYMNTDDGLLKYNLSTGEVTRVSESIGADYVTVSSDSYLIHGGNAVWYLNAGGVVKLYDDSDNKSYRLDTFVPTEFSSTFSFVGIRLSDNTKVLLTQDLTDAGGVGGLVETAVLGNSGTVTTLVSVN